VRDEPEVLALTVHAFTLYSTAFLVMGFNIYGSSLFTSLSNGVISAIISFFRTIVFEIGCVFLLPALIGPDGIWFAMLVAEVASFALTAGFAVRLEPRYGYWTGEAR
jgi:Na+-driven multidrug efflux pump